MPTYSQKKILAVHPSYIDFIANAIKTDFERDSFEVCIDNLISGGKDISVTKGDIFKAVLGMRSALKITLAPQSDGILFEANVGIFGQQAIPTIISMFFFWPVLITQIWGLIQQSSLDDRALAIAEQVAANVPTLEQQTESYKYCPNCGSKLDGSPKFCSNCGSALY